MLKLKNISFSYDQKEVLKDLSLTLGDGEILAVMGPSGCGKSTLLNLIAGLSKPTGGELLSDAKQISYAFQEPRLFPWLTVAENLRAVVPKDTTDEKLREALALVGLSDAADLYPRELSGGMKSRASLARALIYGGDLYLFDEPFAALDEELRRTLSATLRNVIKESGASAILVTHQEADAKALADRIVTLEA